MPRSIRDETRIASLLEALRHALEGEVPASLVGPMLRSSIELDRLWDDMTRDDVRAECARAEALLAVLRDVRRR